MTKYIKLSKACELIDVSCRTLKRYIDEGRISAKRLPSGHWRIDQASLESFMQNKLENRVNEILRSL